MNLMVFATLVAASTATIALGLALLPTLSPNGVVLGVRVPTNQADNPAVRSALAGYRRVMIAVGVVATCVAFVGSAYPPTAIAVPAGLLFGFAAAYSTQRQHLLRAKAEQRWFDGLDTAVSGRVARTQQEPGSAFVWASVLCSTAVTGLSALFVAARWDEIPVEFPTHYGPSFEPDAWTEKSVVSVFSLSLINVAVIALLAFFAWLITSGRVSRRADRTEAGLRRDIEAQHVGLRAAAVLTFVVVTSLAALQVIMPLPQFHDLLAPVTVAMLALTTVCVIGLVASLVKVRVRNRQHVFATGDAESPDNDEHYKWGMFYYNPDDPAVIVDKRTGVGIDFNYATWQGMTFLAVTLATLVGGLMFAFAL